MQTETQQLRTSIADTIRGVLVEMQIEVSKVSMLENGAVSTFHKGENAAQVAKLVLRKAGLRRVRVLPTHEGGFLCTGRVS